MIPLDDLLSPAARRSAVLVLAALILCLVGLGFYASHQRKTASAYQDQAVQSGIREAQALKDARETRTQALKDRAERDKATAEVQRLTKALAAAPRPPAPAPPPAGDPELAKGLETAGLKVGLVLFRGDGPSTLERQDALRVWDWNAHALRVPALELRLDAAENLVNGQLRETQALKVEVRDWTSSSDQWQAAHSASVQREEALQGTVKALQKAAIADRWKTAGEIVLAAAAGYLLRGR